MPKLLKEYPLDSSASCFPPEIIFQLMKNNGNSNTAGPDGLHHLKNLGLLGLQYLTHIYNLSVNYFNIPAIWKHAIIVPVPKSGELPYLGTSYRPISLLRPVVKVLERLLQPDLPLSPNQNSFHANRSTITALLPLAHMS